jgi:hypothetical protein
MLFGNGFDAVGSYPAFICCNDYREVVQVRLIGVFPKAGKLQSLHGYRRGPELRFASAVVHPGGMEAARGVGGQARRVPAG